MARLKTPLLLALAVALIVSYSICSALLGPR